MNKVILLGRLTRDPDVRHSTAPDGTQSTVARYTLAVDRRTAKTQEGQTADFISCVCFGRQGEFAEKYLRQGTKIAISGRIVTGSYTNKDGQKVYTTDVAVDEQEFAESKGGQDQGAVPQNGQQAQQQRPQQAPQQAGGYYQQQAPRQTPGEAWMNIPQGIENDLPFR